MDAETQRDSKEKEVKNEGNGTDSESSTSGRGTPRVDTPGVMPKYQYGREDLYRVRQSPTASRHSCLSKEFDTPDGVWDPERWHRSFGSPHGSSPLTFTRDGIRRDSTSDRKRPAELDRDLLYKRRPSADPKGRIKEEEDEGLGIVLSPQRRSFGTGCHVTTTRHTGSPTDDRERGRSDRVERRIGSGRIQIDRDRDLGLGGRDLGRDKDRELGRDKDFGRDKDRDRDFGRDKDRDRDFGRDKDRDRDFGRDKDRDRDFGRDKDRDRDFGRDKDRERDFGRGMRRERDPDFGPARDDDRDRRGDRDFRDRDRFERRFDSRNDRFGSNRREYGCGESRYDRDRGGRSGRYRHREEVEPEWYSAGPVSQNDTIELHGFDREEKEDLGAKQPKKSRQQSKMMPLRRPSEDKEEPAEALSQEKERKDRPSSTSGADPLKPSHPPGLPQPSDVPTPGSVDFDFNDFFKNFDSIPGLGELGSLPEPEVGMSGVSGSRFSQWFNPSSEHGTSQSNSRRSSLNDEFSYLADMVGTAGGAKSPTSVLSPPALPGNNRLFSPISTAEERQQQDLLNILHEAKMNVQPLTATGHTGPPNHPNSDPGQQHVAKLDHQFSTMTNMAGMHKPPMPTSGLLASDVERDLKAMLMTGNKMGNMNGNRPAGPAPPPAHIKHWLHHGNSNMRGVNHVNKPRDMPLPGKVTTLVELEANMKEMTMGSNSNNMHHHQHQQHQQQHHQQQHTHQQQQHQALNQLQQELAAAKHQQQQQQQAAALVQKTEANMTAFNRLLGLMKFSGALNETPKMPRKADGRPLSPISVAPLPKDMQNPGHQKDLIQQVLAKQQQLQQRQQQQQQQQQQQLKLKQQQVQQQQQFQEILKYVKQNPTIITKPASPIPPAMAATLQPPASPRCASPAVPSLTVPNPPSPRAPSPIMFGSQPPLHLTAPAPIHPGQSQSSSQNLNTLQVNQGAQSPVMARVPSPQELIVHTQAIMQNALIKKQLEDQKERFLKKQHDTSKTPNPLSIQNQAMALNMVLTQTSQNGDLHTVEVSSPVPPTTPVTRNSPGMVAENLGGSTPVASGRTETLPRLGNMTPTQKATVTPAFTPTSVIRKMATDKAEKEEKERHQDITPGNQAPFDPYATFGVRREPDLTSFLIKNGSPELRPPPILQLVQPDRDTPTELIAASCPAPRTPGVSVSSEEAGTITLIPQLDHGPAAAECGSVSGVLAGAADGQHDHHAGNLLVTSPGASGPTMGMKQEMKQPRALVGGQVGPHSAMTMPVAQQSPTSSQGQGRPIVKAAGPMPINQMTRPNPVGAAKPENFRPIVGGHPGMQQNIDIVKLIEAQRIQQQQQQVQQQRQAALSTANTGVSRAGGGGYGGITERLAPSPTPMVHAGVGPAAANAMLLQRMMNPTRQTPSTRPAGLQQLNQVNQLAAQQAQAVQQRSLDPRLQTAAAAAARASLYSMNAGQRGSNFPNNQLTAAAALNAAATLSRALSPQPQLPQPMVSLANDINGPLSPGGYQRAASPNLSAMLGARRPALDNNLAKFFGADIFKQQMPNMPPLPAQGQRVLTVDEIERWSACATCID